jgi:hypothetical protein
LVVTDISADDMLQHEDWYQQYETLKAKQKQAIQEWRTLKDKSSQQNTTNSDSLALHQRNKVECNKDSAEKKQKIEEWKVIHLTLCPVERGHSEFDIAACKVL